VIDYNLVNAQGSSRFRPISGLTVSCFMEKNGRLSAGHVQSVSVRLIVERERDIQEFNAVASYSIVAEFTNETGKSFKAKLPKNFNTKKKRKIF
jgi:DNA topoisomerase-1